MTTTKTKLTSFNKILDEEFGKQGTPTREKFVQEAWEEYNAQVLLDTRKSARLTQQQLADRIGADKAYISRIERGLIVPNAATLYRIISSMGYMIEIKPVG